MMTSPGSISLAIVSIVSSVIRLLDEVLQRLGAISAVGSKAGDRLLVLVVNDCGVAMLHEPADDVATHPPQANHSELHCRPPFLIQRFGDGGIQRLQAGCKIALQMDA
jgi:hypothetical protein